MAVFSLSFAYHPTHVVLDLGWSRWNGIHGMMALQRNSAAVTILSCLPIPIQICKETVALLTFQQHTLVQPLLTCWRQVMYLFVFASSDEKVGYDYWNGSSRRPDYMPSFWLVFFSSWVFHSGTYCVWRVLHISLRQNRVTDLVTLCHVRAKTSISGSCSRHAWRWRWGW